jgi:hypothetical protein
MDKFEIQPVSDSTITEAANFLYSWQAATNLTSSVPGTIRQDCESIEKRLHWLFIENPLTANASQHGFCVRNASSVVVGIILCFANAFLVEDRRLLGLCSGSFFVERSARMQGFYLFRKYLSDTSCDFYFGTTCNDSSGALWKKVGGLPVPHSEKEYVFPLNLEVVLPAFLAARTSSKTAARIAQVLGRAVNPLAQLGRGRPKDLAIEPCQDWQKLSEIFLRHRSRTWITTDRSPEFLKWRYGSGCPDHNVEVCWFKDKHGNEGWFAVAETIRVRGGRILRGALLLDAVWPRDKIEFKQLLSAILNRPTVRAADAIYFHPRLDVNLRDCSALIIPRTVPGPKAFALACKGVSPIDVSKLDLVPADGDTTF